MLNKKSVDDICVKGQKVLVRCDFNVPLQDGVITDENRLVAALPTLKKLIADGGRLILCSHLGKPKGEPKPELSLAPVAKRLAERSLGLEVSDAAKQFIIEQSFDPLFGARPMKRYIQDNLETLIARCMLENDLSMGDRLVVDRGPAGLSISIVRHADDQLIG